MSDKTRKGKELEDQVGSPADEGSLPNPVFITNEAEGGGGAVEQLAAIARSPALGTTERQVTLRRAEQVRRDVESVFWAINLHTEALSFNRYDDFVQTLFCDLNGGSPDPGALLPVDFRDRAGRLEKLHRVPASEAYELLRAATEVFLLLNCGTHLDTRGRLRMSLPEHHDQEGDEAEEDAAGSEANERSAGRQALRDRTLPQGVDRLGGGVSLTYKEAQEGLERFLSKGANNYLETVIRGAFPGGTVSLASPFCLAAGEARFDAPCLLELIWSYWMEEGMLNQTVAALTRRFQNVRRAGRGPDPLAELELDPLRPLSAFLWGYLQDEPSRLSVVRRAYEYNHHYGLTLYGRAVPPLRPADPRARFLEAFHNLLRQAAAFYKEDNDTTVIADAFPVLNSLKEVHLLLSEGAHNQFRDLPWTARAEMLLQQWLLARPETRDFLRGRYMVAYPEPWMGAVDAMKRLQGWTDASVLHFRDLARFGERILLSIRYVNWSGISSQEDARVWLRYWKEEVQGYIHAYQAVTGVGLSDEVVDVRTRADVRYRQPSWHLRNRLVESRRAARRLQR